jgi:secretory lipase
MAIPPPPTGWYPDLAVRSADAPAASAALRVPPPAEDPFYTYSGSTPLHELAPGTVLATRSVPYHILGIPTALKATQLLYRSTSQVGKATANVTSVIQPLGGGDKIKVVSFQSAYDSLSRNDQPSHAISGGLTLGGVVTNVELFVFGPLLAQGCTVLVPDTEGQRADFAAGPEYGMNTLDSMRAALASPAVGLPESVRIGMIGYSGGAIASEWAAELAPRYAPEINARMVGAAIGGLLVHPAHNLHYVEGTYFWAGVMPMALIGIARAFEVDLTPFLTERGARLFRDMQATSIVNVLGGPRFWRLRWSDLVLAEYPTPESLPLFVTLANQLIMGTGGTPTIPLFIGQGANGDLEWTPNDQQGIGPGDGVMIAGDVRTLARHYCDRGVKVLYKQYDAWSHTTSVPFWLGPAIDWISDRLDGQAAPQNCSSIAPGNRLDPIPQP